MKSKTKFCRGCKQHLPRTVAHFWRDRARPDGFVSRCTNCYLALPRQRKLVERSSLRAIADAQLLTEAQFWETWQELLEAFAVDDNAYVVRNGRLFQTDFGHLTSGDGRSARMENV